MENLSKKPSKGILKSSSSFEQQNDCPVQQKQEHSHSMAEKDKDIKWDEMNIMQTLHPADKDYGHMKIEEPKTPYNYNYETTDGEQLSDHESHGLDANTLAEKIAKKAMESPSILKSLSSEEDEESDDENLTEDEKRKKREFEIKRKMHYNEFQAVKLARKLLEEEGEEDDDDDDTDKATTAAHSADTSQRNGSRQTNDQVFDISGNEQIDSEDIDSVQNR